MRIAIVGSGIAGLGSAWLLQRQGHAVTLFEAERLPRRAHAHGRRHARRRHRAGGHRLPGLQRPHLSAPDRAVRRAGRGERRQRDVVLGARRRAPARVGGHRPRGAVRAAAQRAAARRSGGCSPTSCASTATTTAMLASDAVLVDVARRVPRRASATRRAVPRLVPAADGGGDLVVAEAATSSTSRCRRSSASATTTACCRSPTGRSGAPCVGGAREYVAQIAAALPDVRLAHAGRSASGARARGVEVDAGGRAERFDEVVLACHSDQALALLADPSPRGDAAAGGDPLPAQPRRAAHRRRAAAARRAARGRRGTTSPPPTPTATRPVAVSYLINKLQPLPFRDAGDRHAEPAVRAGSGAGAAGVRVLRTRCSTAARSPRSRRIRARCRACATPGTPAPGWATASTRTASSRRTRSPTGIAAPRGPTPRVRRSRERGAA